MSREGLSAIVLATLCAVHGVQGMYEEDVGRWDWQRENFGSIQVTELPSSAAKGRTGRMVYFGGDSGIVGGVWEKSGVVAWRRVTNDDTPVSALRLVRASQLLIAVSKSRVFALAPEDGALLAETTFQGQVLGVVPEIGKKGPAIVVLAEDLGALAIAFHDIRTDDDGSVHFDTVTPSRTVSVSQVLKSRIVSSGASLASGFAVTDTAIAFAAPSNKSTTDLFVLSTEAATWSDPSTVQLPGTGPVALAARCKGAVVLSRGGRDTLVDLTTKAVAEVTGEAVGCGETKDGAVVSVSAEVKESGLGLKVAGGKEEAEWGVSEVLLDRVGPAKRVWVIATEKGWRAVVTFDEDSTAFLSGTPKQAKLVWTREDGIGRAKDVVVTDIPHGEGKEESAQAAYVHLLRDQVSFVSNFISRLPEHVSTFIADVTGAPRGAGSQVDPISPDHFGLRRLVVVATARSVSGLLSVSGRLVWHRHLGSVLPEGARRGFEVEQVFHSENEHNELPLLIVWVHLADARDAVIRLNHMTGAVISVQVYPERMRMGSVLHDVRFQDKVTEADYPALFFVDGKYRIHAFPQSVTSSLQEDAKVYFHEVDTEAGEVRGYSVSASGATPAWSVRLQSAAGERIVATSLNRQSPFHYVVKDNVRVLPNKTTGKNELHTKYINPNAILIVTHVAENATALQTGTQRRQGGYLVLYLVDGVTGALLSSMVQTNAQPPVQIVAMENMFVYHFLNTKRVRYQLGVWELFDDLDRYRGLTAETTTPLSFVAKSLVGSRASHVTSAFVQPPPHVSASAFTFPSAVRGITPTVSARGIQTKHIVAALASDELVAIDLFRHIQAGVSALAWPPTQTVSHNRTVHGVTDMRSFPTNLESTSLVAAFGTDLFFARVCPVKPFDMLGDDFAYSMLILTVSGVSLISFLCYYFAQRKKLKSQWE
eukprot:Hpha_TRINITY_DN13796_c0_g1::TRINITY_DN13796_c0_g1_i1::g.142551::m.142551